MAVCQDNQLRRFLVHKRLEQFCHGQRLQFGIGFHQNGAVGPDGHGRAQGFLASRRAAGHRDDFFATPASFKRTASSTAISSNGFIDILTLARSISLPSLLTRALTL